MSNNIKCIFFVLSIFVIHISCGPNQNKTKEWTYLFDGSSMEGWRAYNESEMPPGWKIIDSVLTFKTQQILEQDFDYKKSRDIIYGDKMLSLIHI